MTSLVSELQVRAIDPNASVSELLRMAKIVASKLELTEFREWIDAELAGYPDGEVPPYRVITGVLKARNPYVGLIPVKFQDDSVAHDCSTRKIHQKISEIEALSCKTDEIMQMPFSGEQQILLQNWFGIDFEFKLLFAPTVLIGIVDSVRNVILNWSLKLEQSGIKGEGMTFSTKDKEKAHASGVSYQIGSIGQFTGSMGNVSDHSVVNAASTAGVDTAGILTFVAQLREHSDQFGFDTNQKAELLQTLSSLKAVTQASKPELSELSALFASLKSLMLSTTSSLLVHGALAEIAKYSDHLPKF